MSTELMIAAQKQVYYSFSNIQGHLPWNFCFLAKFNSFFFFIKKTTWYYNFSLVLRYLKYNDKLWNNRIFTNQKSENAINNLTI